MSVVIIYGSVEGQTAKVARFARDQAILSNQDVELCNVAKADGALLDRAGAVILAASVHERRHPRAFETYLTTHLAALKSRKTLLLSVSLSAAFPERRAEAQDYVDELKMRTGLRPSSECLVAGAIRHATYDQYARQVMTHVLLGGRPFDETQDHEFTDWTALKSALEAFWAPAEAAG